MLAGSTLRSRGFSWSNKRFVVSGHPFHWRLSSLLATSALICQIILNVLESLTPYSWFQQRLHKQQMLRRVCLLAYVLHFPKRTSGTLPLCRNRSRAQTVLWSWGHHQHRRTPGGPLCRHSPKSSTCCNSNPRGIGSSPTQPKHKAG